MIVNSKDDLAIIAMESSNSFGKKLDERLLKIRKEKESYNIPVTEVHFNSGEGKVCLEKSIRNKDVYILTDVYNYNNTYKMREITNHTSPKDHFMDIISVISAIRGLAKRITVIMPMLYASRQHKRKGRESSDCALALQILENLGVKCIITFDAHDPNIQNVVPFMSLDNFYPTKHVILDMLKNKEIDFNNLLVISPDPGAMDRARFLAETLKTNVGMFYKRRDLSKVIDGKNPIVAHEYLGENVTDKEIIIVDDMISSGDSILETAQLTKDMGAKNIYLCVTFALFDHGIEVFNKAYENGIIKGLYTTNLIYLSEETKNTPWINIVDISEYLADIIDTYNKNEPISPLIYNNQGIYELLNEMNK